MTGTGTNADADTADTGRMPRPRHSRHLPALLLASSTVTATAAVVLLAISCVMGLVLSSGIGLATSPASPSSVVTRDGAEMMAKANVDTDGLRQIAAAVEGMSGITGSTEIDGNADRLIYYFLGDNLKPCWPISDGSTHPLRRCFNCALVHLYCLTTGDYTMTTNKMLDLHVELYGQPSDDVFWPWPMEDWMEESCGIHMRQLSTDDPEISSKADIYEEAKKELIAGHPLWIACGAGDSLDFYNQDGSVRHPQNGHTVIIYKYVDGFFYVKDSTAGPCVAYPERGGAIDMFDWIAGSTATAKPKDKGGRAIAFYTDDDEPTKVAPQWPRNVQPQPEPVNGIGPGPGGAGAVREAYLASEQGQGAKGASLASESTSYEDVFAMVDTDDDWQPSGTSVMEDTPLPLSDAETSSLLAPPAAGPGRSSEWIRGVLAATGDDKAPPGTASAWYWSAVRSGASTTETDPEFFSLMPGMVVGTPLSSSSDDDSCPLGHVGIYVGDGQVIHDRNGVVERRSWGEFLQMYDDVVPVAWWPPEAGDPQGHADGDGSAGDGTDGNTGYGIPAPASSGTGSVSSSDVQNAVAFAIAGAGVTPGDVTGVRLVGQGDSSWSYVASLASGDSVGVLASTDPSGTFAVVAGLLPVNGSLVYDVATGEHVPFERHAPYEEEQAEIMQTLSLSF